MPVTPLLPDDPPKVGDFWLDARLGATPAGIAFTAHDAANTPAMVILLSEGAAADAAARARLAGEIKAAHRHGARTGRPWARHWPARPQIPQRGRRSDCARRPFCRPVGGAGLRRFAGCSGAGYVDPRRRADCNAAAAGRSGRPRLPAVLDRTGTSGSGAPWPLPWPGRFDRAGWRTILVSWLLMLLLAALAVLIAILIFRNQPPQSPPRPQAAPSGRHSPDRPSQAHNQGPRSPGTIGIPILRVAWTVGHRIGRREPTESATGSPAASNTPRSRL